MESLPDIILPVLANKPNLLLSQNAFPNYHAERSLGLHTKRLDEYGHRIKIIRDIDNKEDIGSKFYCRLAPGLTVKGKVIRNEVNLELFQVTKVLNENDILSNSIDDKEWEINEI